MSAVIVTRKVSYGNYELLNGGERVATVRKTVDSSEPFWTLLVLDGTNTDFNGKPSRLDRFPTLASATSAYRYYARVGYARVGGAK